MGLIDISLNFRNNTDAIIPMSILGNPSNLADISNQTREFQWDVTALSFTTENYVSVDYRPNALANFTTYTAPLLSLSIQGVLDALNNLGIGSFFTYTSGGNTYISNYDDSYVFGDINVFDTNQSSTISQFYATSGTGGDNYIDLNGTTIWSAPSNPVSFIGSFTAYSGNSIHVYGIAGSAGINLQVINTTLSVTLTNQNIIAGLPYTYTFSPFNGDAFTIQVT